SLASFFQAEDGIRDRNVTGVQTCALPISLKGAVFAANIYEKLGYPVVPNGTESRHDIIQAVTFGSPEGVIAFCKGIQAAAPVDRSEERRVGEERRARGARDRRREGACGGA